MFLYKLRIAYQRRQYTNENVEDMYENCIHEALAEKQLKSGRKKNIGGQQRWKEEDMLWKMAINKWSRRPQTIYKSKTGGEKKNDKQSKKLSLRNSLPRNIQIYGEEGKN